LAKIACRIKRSITQIFGKLFHRILQVLIFSCLWLHIYCAQNAGTAGRIIFQAIIV